MMDLKNIPEEQLPDWMRLAMRGTDWGVLIVLCIALMSGWYFIWHDALPNGLHYESYVWRIGDLSGMMQEGTLFPRWSYYALNGYGAPVYHYVPPGASYLGAVVATLFTGGAVDAIRVIVVMSLCLAGGTLYSLLMRLADARVGLLGAVLYMVNPFTLSVVLFRTGNLDLLLGMALMPTVLWATHRWLMQRDSFNFSLLALSHAGLILSKPDFIVVVLFLGGALFYHVRQVRWVWLGWGWAWLCGMGLSAFYWLPALLERDFLSWMAHEFQSSSDGVTLGAFFSLPLPIDSALVVPQMAISPGWWLPLVALGGFWMSWRQDRYEGFFFWSGGVLGVLAPGWAWLSQSYEVIGWAVLGLAMSGSFLARWEMRAYSWWRRVLLSGLVMITLVAAQSSWIGTQTRFISVPSLETYIRGVIAGYGEVLLPRDAYMPTTLERIPASNRQMVQEYLSGQNSHLFSNRSEGIQVNFIESAGLYQRYQLRTDEVMMVRLEQAYFEGWEAYLNDVALEVGRDASTGLMTIQLPETNNSELHLLMGTTPLRLLGWSIAWMTVAGLAIGLWRFKYDEPMMIISHKRYLAREDARLMGIGLAIFGMMAVFLMVADTPLRLQPAVGTSLQDAVRVQYRTDVGLRLIGFRMGETRIRQGDVLPLDLWWQSARGLDENYYVQILVRNVMDNQQVVVSALKVLGDYPTVRWERDATALDRHKLSLPPDLASGRYSVNVALVRCLDSCDVTDSLTFFDTAGNSVGTRLTLPQLIIVGD